MVIHEEKMGVVLQVHLLILIGGKCMPLLLRLPLTENIKGENDIQIA